MKPSSIINKCKKDMKSRLGHQANGDVAIQTIEVFLRATDQLLKQRLKDRPPVTFACQKGCDLCCHLRIEALPPEALRIGQYLNEQLNEQPGEQPAEHRAALIQRLEKHALYARDKAYRDYQAACPFLADGGICSIYPVRPRICRTHLSRSRSACEIPGNAQPDAALQQAEDTLALQVITLYKDRHLTMHPAELSQAVLQTLTDEATKPRWLAGEDVFARLPEGITL